LDFGFLAGVFFPAGERFLLAGFFSPADESFFRVEPFFPDGFTDFELTPRPPFPSPGPPRGPRVSVYDLRDFVY